MRDGARPRGKGAWESILRIKRIKKKNINFNEMNKKNIFRMMAVAAFAGIAVMSCDNSAPKMDSKADTKAAEAAAEKAVEKVEEKTAEKDEAKTEE